eukprot:1967171-Amphidinium_carterae.2
MQAASLCGKHRGPSPHRNGAREGFAIDHHDALLSLHDKTQNIDTRTRAHTHIAHCNTSSGLECIVRVG